MAGEDQRNSLSLNVGRAVKSQMGQRLLQAGRQCQFVETQGELH